MNATVTIIMIGFHSRLWQLMLLLAEEAITQIFFIVLDPLSFSVELAHQLSLYCYAFLCELRFRQGLVLALSVTVAVVDEVLNELFLLSWRVQNTVSVHGLSDSNDEFFLTSVLDSLHSA